METNYKQHWDEAFEKTETEKLGWYETTPQKTLELIHHCNIPKDARILNVGVGTTTLIEALIEEGFTNILASDLSTSALDLLKKRVQSDKVTYVQDDLTHSQNLKDIEPIDLWIDRAVLHFFNEEKDQKAYWELLNKVLKPGGYALIAAFSLQGAEKCCGLPVHRYSADMLAKGIGTDFQLEEASDYTFINPHGGERPYVYTLFRKNF
ncbi:MAG: class I SAM-dependent methyltransferase [Crocinitomicaceae bacterium]